MKIGVGLFGTRAHQIHAELVDHPQARLLATAAFDKKLPEALGDDPEIRRYETLEELLQDDRVELVSLCSPRRRDQAEQAIRCMEAGRHVYAEKPCAMTEEDLDALIETSKKTGRQFHEMSNTAFGQPYLAMRKLVQEGVIGTVVQVFAQKSYPYVDRRPQDEDVDGGMMMQVGVHALRYVEQVAGQEIVDIRAQETQLGNPKEGNLHMAASFMMSLANGGVATAIANYLNPTGFGSWGNEHLRIFGTNGFVEAVDAGTRTRLVVGDEDRGEVDASEPSLSYFDMYTALLQGEGEMPFDLATELHPTRMVIRAKRSAE
jgi:predicted dehydrogenase